MWLCQMSSLISSHHNRKQSHLLILLALVGENISRHMALCGVCFDSPEMEDEVLRAIITALPSSCHWHVCPCVISLHSFPILLWPDERRPGQYIISLASWFALFSQKSDHFTAVVSNYVPWMFKRLQLFIPTRGSGSCSSQRW